MRGATLAHIVLLCAGVAGAALYLLSDLGKSCTGEVHHVDAGFHIVGMPDPEALKGD